ncbi:MAG: lipopolysaccharide biosynthesis protein [Deltaproteobacteria bacterium]|nr:lipopolysaccharide biosynthesis protein [Deltaproteobacteria bacterium]
MTATNTYSNKLYTELAKDLFLYGLLTGLTGLVGLILLPIFTRIFSQAEYGIIEIVAVAANLITVVACLSLESAVVRYLPQIKDAAERKIYFSTILVVVIAVAVFLFLLCFILSEHISSLLFKDGQYALLITLSVAAAAIAAISGVVQMALRVERKIFYFNALNIIHILLYGVVSLLLHYYLHLGVSSVFYGLLTAEVIRLLWGLTLTRHLFSKRLSREDLKISLKFSLPLLPAVLATCVNNQLSRFVVLFFIGLSGVAIFGATAKIALIIVLLTSAFSQAWTPYALSLLDMSVESRDLFYRNILSYYMAGFLSLGLLIVALSPELFKVLIPVEYYSGYLLVPWIIGAFIIRASGSITAIGVLISEKTIANPIAAWIGTVINITVGITLAHFFGIVGVVIGIFIAEIAFTATLWFFTAKHTAIRFNIRIFAASIICYIFTSIALLLITQHLQDDPALYVLKFILLVIAASVLFFISTDKTSRRTFFSTIRDLPKTYF